MAYRFLTASMPLFTKTPKDEYREGFQEVLTEQFYNSSDWWTIEQEYPYQSGEYKDVDVRINNIVSNQTGFLQGDDYKTLLFNDIDYQVGLGYLFRFDSNYWIVINVTKIKSLTSTATVKRCNNMLRWVGLDGGLYSHPCSIDYLLKENRDYSTGGTALVIPSGFIEVVTQFNDQTNKIKNNQRFLFGNADNWLAYKVFGDGISNYNNLRTTDNMSSGFIKLTLGANYVNLETDDTTNGIADYYTNVYTLAINDDAVSGVIGNSNQLVATVTFNGRTVSRDITWTSSDTSIATVSATGLVTFVANGTCTITATIENNTSVGDTCSVTVAAAPINEYQVIISPDINYIYEGLTREYEIWLYLNGVKQADVFTCTLSPGTVPSENYMYQQTGDNKFTISNMKRYLDDDLEVACVSGAYNKTISISLKGAW